MASKTATPSPLLRLMRPEYLLGNSDRTRAILSRLADHENSYAFSLINNKGRSKNFNLWL
ncbi:MULTISPECIES: hypothetical protein [Fischerella]|uniref:hypothetical protein n=1 Tax=Fischerella TaxID=1190 RepID=UPI001161296F|nr:MULTISPECIES: hypothetical protein [Fischerella]